MYVMISYHKKGCNTYGRGRGKSSYCSVNRPEYQPFGKYGHAMMNY